MKIEQDMLRHAPIKRKCIKTTTQFYKLLPQSYRLIWHTQMPHFSFLQRKSFCEIQTDLALRYLYGTVPVWKGKIKRDVLIPVEIIAYLKQRAGRHQRSFNRELVRVPQYSKETVGVDRNILTSACFVDSGSAMSCSRTKG